MRQQLCFVRFKFPNTFVLHCVKSFLIWSHFDPYFPAFGLNTDQNNFEYGRFLHSVSTGTRVKFLLKKRVCLYFINI